MHIGQIHLVFLFGYVEVEIIGTLTTVITVNFKSMEVNANHINLSEWGARMRASGLERCPKSLKEINLANS